jgi:hypothetical protein
MREFASRPAAATVSTRRSSSTGREPLRRADGHRPQPKPHHRPPIRWNHLEGTRTGEQLRATQCRVLDAAQPGDHQTHLFSIKEQAGANLRLSATATEAGRGHRDRLAFQASVAERHGLVLNDVQVEALGRVCLPGSMAIWSEMRR